MFASRLPLLAAAAASVAAAPLASSEPADDFWRVVYIVVGVTLGTFGRADTWWHPDTGVWLWRSARRDLLAMGLIIMLANGAASYWNIERGLIGGAAALVSYLGVSVIRSVAMTLLRAWLAAKAEKPGDRL